MYLCAGGAPLTTFTVGISNDSQSVRHIEFMTGQKTVLRVSIISLISSSNSFDDVVQFGVGIPPIGARGLPEVNAAIEFTSRSENA